MQGIRRGRLEIGQVEVELTSLLAFGVDKDRSHANLVACSCGPLKSILHEGLPQPLPLRAEVDPESSQEDDRDGMVARTPLDALRGGLSFNRASRQSVIADDTSRPSSTHDVDPARPRLIRLEGMLSEPIVQRS